MNLSPYELARLVDTLIVDATLDLGDAPRALPVTETTAEGPNANVALASRLTVAVAKLQRAQELLRAIQTSE